MEIVSISQEFSEWGNGYAVEVRKASVVNCRPSTEREKDLQY
jgi:hypothetical protein